MGGFGDEMREEVRDAAEDEAGGCRKVGDD